MAHRPIIHVMGYGRLMTSEYPNVMPIYHLDESSLAVPTTWFDFDQNKLLFEYRAWLHGHIEIKTPAVEVALDNIYNQAINGGVVIATYFSPIPFITHAHVVREVILELAKEDP